MSPAQRRTRAQNRPRPSRTRRRALQESQNGPTQPLVSPPLELHHRQIRILRLLPALSRTDPIRCTLNTAYLDKNPYYEALSYVWGDPTVTRQIFVNNRAVNVTENLAAALRRLRRRFEDRRLWVDALCINQRDDAEKSHQVNLMKDIYSKAPVAILWLGDYSDGPVASPTLGVGTPPNPSAVMTKREVATAFRVLRRLDRDKLDGCGVPPRRIQLITPDEVSAIENLLQLPWWTRIWTVQEAVLPKVPTIMYGTMQIPLDTLIQASINSQQHYFQGCCDQRRLDVLWDVVLPLNYMRETDNLTPDLFSDALNMFRHREASDPRDRVFALLGLGATIAADYSLPWKEVFVGSVRQQIIESGCLDILKRIQERHTHQDFPSWAPDWCAEVDGDFHQTMLWLHIYSYYGAAGEEKAKVGRSSLDSVLTLQGWVADEVFMVGEYWKPGWKRGAPDVVTAQWKGLIAKSCSCPYEQGYDDAFWQVLACGLSCSQNLGFRYRRVVAADEAESRRLWEDPLHPEAPAAMGTRFFITKSGKIGVGNRDIMAGDIVTVLLGGNMPFILRPTGGKKDNNSTFYKLVGQSYVHGIMDGEVTREGVDPEWISLV